MDVDEKGALFEGYELKLNSYDLGVDIELADAIERLRFEHPEVQRRRCCARASRGCSAPAPISACWRARRHAHKVNFCKFTNETRNGIEDASENSGLHDHLRDQRHGGGRRLRARARGRSHHAGRRRLVGGVAAGTAAAGGAAGHRRAHARHRQAQGAPRPCRCVLHHRGRREGQARGRLAAGRRSRAGLEVRRNGRRSARKEFAAKSQRRDGAPRASRSTPLKRERSRTNGVEYSSLSVEFDRGGRHRHHHVARAATRCRPTSAEAMVELGAEFWPLRLARELDDAILDIRAERVRCRRDRVQVVRRSRAGAGL